MSYNNQQAPPPPSLTPQQESSRPIDSGSSGLVTSLTRPEDIKKEGLQFSLLQFSYFTILISKLIFI